jgi:phage terminase large subunit
MRITYKPKPPPKLIPIYSTNKRYVCLRGGRGSAKSWSVADLFLRNGLREKCRILCAREVQNTIRDSVHKLLYDRIQFYGLQDFYLVKNDTIVGLNGTDFIFKGLLRNTQDIKSAEGIKYCWVEEAQTVSRQSLKDLIPTIRVDNSQIFFTYNPTNDDDPVHVDYTLTHRDDCLNIEINYHDNPYFPAVLQMEMEYDRSHDIDKYHHVWCGETIKHSEAQVFYGKWVVDEFEAPANTFFYFGADWGFSKDPTVLVRMFECDGNLYVDHEIYRVGLDIDLIPSEFKTIPLSDKFPMVADSQRPDTISYVRQRGFPLIESSKKGKGSVEDGIAHLRKYKKIVIHPRCKNTIYEMRTYSYVVDKKTGVISNKIEDKANHAIDSMRYAAEKMRGFKPVALTADGKRL